MNPHKQHMHDGRATPRSGLRKEDIENELLEIFRTINDRFPSGRMSAYIEYNFNAGKMPDTGQVVRDLQYICEGRNSKYEDKNSKDYAGDFIKQIKGLTTVMRRVRIK